MSDPVVTVARFSNVLEAQLAKNFLENEGIPVQIVGDKAAGLQLGVVGGFAQLYVREWDAERAAELLAEHFEKAELAADWMDHADDDVWLCPTCGEAIRDEFDECTACSTRREGIQIKDRVTGKRWAPPPSPPPTTDVTVDRPPELDDSPHAFDPGELDLEPLGGEKEFVQRDIRLNPGDELASRALFWAFISFAFPGFCVRAFILVARIGNPETELTPAGRRRYWCAILLSLAAMVLWLLLWFNHPHL